MIVINVLEGCPYCNNSLNVLDNFNIKYKKTVVEQNEKNKFKKKYNMDTFPQVLLELNNKHLVLGGNQDLMNSINLIQQLNKTNISNEAFYLLLKELRN